MEKVIPVGSWDFGIEPIATIKVARNKLLGSDRQELLTKRAAAPVFADMVKQSDIKPGDIPIHTIAIGATEKYGSNRNGDGFDIETCIKRAHTFESSPLSDWPNNSYSDNGARYYQHHKNRDPDTSYGFVKAASYNAKMGRIELFILANGTKAAAKRNGGLVLPDSTLEKLARHEFIAGSMSCHLPFDRCVICNHKAASPKDYCDENSCVDEVGNHGLGCKAGLTKLLKNGRQQFVENPNCTFFDFSEVGRPADRTAYGGVANYLTKVAEHDPILGGARLAEKYAVANCLGPIEFAGDYVDRWAKIARDLSQIEDVYSTRGIPADLQLVRNAYHPDLQPALDMEPLRPYGTAKCASGFRALAARRVLLSPQDFLQLVYEMPASEKIAKAAQAIAVRLPGIYTRMSKEGFTDTAIAAAWMVDGTTPVTLKQQVFAKTAEESRSAAIYRVQERAVKAASRRLVRPDLSRETLLGKSAAADHPGADKLATEYALYKLAFLAELPTKELILTRELVVLHNYQ